MTDDPATHWLTVLPGDTFEIQVDAFGLPLRNTLAVAPALSGAVMVKQL